MKPFCLSSHTICVQPPAKDAGSCEQDLKKQACEPACKGKSARKICKVCKALRCMLVAEQQRLWPFAISLAVSSAPALTCDPLVPFQLPGVEACENYTFRYGRNPLMELPLAINPTGCARSEPKMSTHVKRFVLRYFLLNSHSTAQGL